MNAGMYHSNYKSIGLYMKNTKQDFNFLKIGNV